MKNKKNKNNIKVDRFYNLIQSGGSDYGDKLSGIINEISEAREKGEITDTEMNMLIKIALMMDYQREIKDLSEWIAALNENQEQSSALINFTQRERKYV